MNDQSIRNIACAYRKIGQTIEHSIGSYLLKEHSPYNQQHFSQTKILPNETAYYPFLVLLVLSSCAPNSKQTDSKEPLIGKNTVHLTSDVMTPEVLWAFGRLSDVQVSPDGTKLLYGVSYYSVAQNKGNRELFYMNADGSGKTQIT